MIKVPENGREGVCVEVGAKHFVVAFQRLSKDGGEHKVEQACTKLVPMNFLRIQEFGDLVQGPSKPKI